MKKYVTLTIVLIFTVLSFSCNGKQPAKIATSNGEINRVTPLEFQEKLKNNTLIDIRTPREFAQGYIEGAVNINYYDRAFIEQISKFDKSKPIFIYCRSGSRTSSASKKISNLGFTQVYELNGGIVNWYRNKLKIVK
ncbi:rhodanese-like domain-containing protein [Lutibacter sp. TH_r2]|uniref:rhodanese-like domain-containing protein n=1 Tax=Lutibacter sp. TH_r2 TaxID=3082083 RepID=UPI002952BDD2|nr:rhodanese-like domain-containing protein [Lutibacter sp. TH_r2]MDV7186932.1 rhodanese-like domain-containing protein [Lutibacter sp. TH_r2]